MSRFGIRTATRPNALTPTASKRATGVTILLGATVVALLAMLSLSACTATQVPDAVAPSAPGFLLGLWHGFIFPVAWVVSLFLPKIAIYAVPNDGGWYDFGYFLGIVVFGVGARKTQVVTRNVYRDRGGTIVDSTATRID